MRSALHTFPSRPRALRVALVVALALCAAGCVTYDQELHVSPLWSDLSTAGGGREREGLAGVVRHNQPAPDARWSRWSLRPLVTKSRNSTGDSLMHYLVPLGTRLHDRYEVVDQFLPLARYEKRIDSEGRVSWRFFMLP